MTQKVTTYSLTYIISILIKPFSKTIQCFAGYAGRDHSHQINLRTSWPKPCQHNALSSITELPVFPFLFFFLICVCKWKTFHNVSLKSEYGVNINMKPTFTFTITIPKVTFRFENSRCMWINQITLTPLCALYFYVDCITLYAKLTYLALLKNRILVYYVGKVACTFFFGRSYYVHTLITFCTSLS